MSGPRRYEAVFDRVDGGVTWRHTRDGSDLLEALSQEIKTATGRTIDLTILVHS